MSEEEMLLTPIDTIRFLTDPIYNDCRALRQTYRP